jgi:hypothetical protein
MNVRIPLALLACIVVAGCAAGRLDLVPHRVVAIGDIHADIDVARAAFQLAGAINEEDEWIGGDLVVVQTGDIIGRSYQDREVLDFILALRKKARAAGGRIHSLIGNHEFFGTILYVVNVSAEAYAAFDGVPDLHLDNPLLAHLPEHQRARAAALLPGGHYAKQLADFPTVLLLGETVYVHGGVTPYWASYGIDRINDEVSEWFAGRSRLPAPIQSDETGDFGNTVLFSRDLSLDVDEEDCAALQESLRILGAKRMIVAHTVQESITARCDGKVWAIDVGMSRFYGGPIQVLEIVDDEKLRVISELASR